MSVPLPDWLRAIYPFDPKRFDTGRGVMSYLDEGAGDEAVVMVHGNPTWSFYYRNLVLGLRGKIRCIVPDHLGCGLSDKPQDFNYTLGEHIRNLRALFDSLKLRKIHLIVHDWGGPIGLGAALAKPEQLGGVVILNTAAFAESRCGRTRDSSGARTTGFAMSSGNDQLSAVERQSGVASRPDVCITS